MDKTAILEILKSLSEVKIPRTTLYLNIDRVKEQYFQNGGLETIETSDTINSEVNAKITAAVASVEGNVSNTMGIKGELSVSPLLMAILLEKDSQRNNLLVDPATTVLLPKGSLLKRIANTYLVRPSEIVTSQTSKLSDDMAFIVQTERERQMKDYEDLGFSRKTVVWTDKSRMNVASIVSTEFLNPNSFTSYAHGLIGILGLLEKEVSNIRFIAPLWLWHEGFSHDK